MLDKKLTREYGAHWLIAQENPVTVMRNVAPDTLEVNLIHEKAVSV